MISKKNYLTKHRLIVSYVQLDCQMLIPNNAWLVKTYVYQARSLFLCGHFCKVKSSKKFLLFLKNRHKLKGLEITVFFADGMKKLFFLVKAK